MKTLKLEVGKTYRSREGKEVKIVGMNRESGYQFKGSNGEWYKENGSFWYHEHPYDLIEEVGSTRHTFSIPEGVKKVTVEEVGNRIVVEMVPEDVETPKAGDAEIMEVEEIPESTRIREWVWANLKSDLFAKGNVAEAIEAYLKHREGEK